MRLRKLNPLVMVAVSSTLAGMTASMSGCKSHPAQPKAPLTSHPIAPATTESTQPSTEPTTEPATTAPTTGPTTAATTAPTTEATTEPATQPATMPAVTPPIPTTVPAIPPATEPAVATTLPATTAPTTVPAVVPAPTTVPAIPPVIPLPTTAPATQPIIPTPIPAPATLPVIPPPTTAPATQPIVPAVPTTAPATMPAAVVPTTEPTSQPTTQATAPATQPVAVALPPTHDAPPVTDPDVQEADASLADRLSSIAELSFPDKVSDNTAWPFIWRHQAGIYAAAATLDPTEARYSRLRADALAQIHDLDQEAEALHQAVLAKPDDEFSWNKRLDLFLSQMQTADLQVKYLREVMASNLVPPDVRAHAGFRCAQSLMDRGQDAMAASVVDEALRDNPSSIECLKLRYAMLPTTATRYERCGRLLDLLHANPLQPEYSAQLAELVAGSGLIRQSLPWYMLAVGSAHKQGIPAQSTMLNYAAALYIGDQKTDSSRTVAALLQIDPKFYPAWFMELLLARASGDSDQLNKTLLLANNVFSNRVVEVINKVGPATANAPTTRPITSEGAYVLPDLAPVVAKLNHEGSDQDKRLFVEAVADLARFDIYFAQQPDAAGGLLEALHGVLPDNDPLLAELQGWAAVLSNKPDDARAKLTSIAADDPLAQLGLLKLMSSNPDNREETESLARKLVQDNPSGLVGAIIWDGLSSERVKLILTPQAVALGQQLATFPPNLLGMGEKPQATYSIHAQPVMIGRYFGEPLLAQVTIENMSSTDLTVGDDGVLKPQLIFDLTAKTGKIPQFKAIDTLACPTVIKPHMFVQQVVRLDQSQMLSFLNDTNGIAFEVSGVLATNQTANGLGGYAAPFTKSFYRLASPVTPEKMDNAITNVTTGRPEQKITSLGLLELFVQKLREVKDPSGNPSKAIPVLMDTIHKARSDDLPGVAAWASKCEFDLANDADRASILRDLAEDADWRHRELAVLLVPSAEPSLGKEVLAKLIIDPQSCVRADATAMQGMMSIPSTQPTTAP